MKNNQTSVRTQRVRYYIAYKLFKLGLAIMPFGQLRITMADEVQWFESDYKYRTREIHK